MWEIHFNLAILNVPTSDHDNNTHAKNFNKNKRMLTFIMVQTWGIKSYGLLTSTVPWNTQRHLYTEKCNWVKSRRHGYQNRLSTGQSFSGDTVHKILRKSWTATRENVFSRPAHYPTTYAELHTASYLYRCYWDVSTCVDHTDTIRHRLCYVRLHVWSPYTGLILTQRHRDHCLCINDSGDHNNGILSSYLMLVVIVGEEGVKLLEMQLLTSQDCMCV